MQMHSHITQRVQRDLIWVERIAWLMDDKFRIKGNRFRFGLDPLINLVPFLGNAAGFAVSIVLVAVMLRNGASRKLVMLMLINVIVDVTLGAIPLFGQVFDFFFKANQKNIILLQEYYYKGKHQGRGNDIIAIVISLFLILTVLLLFLLWKGFLWMINLF
jgi:hypothetical protein